MNKMWKFVITGGPCGGKTSVIDELKQEFGNKVIFVPEVATQLLNVFPVPNRDVSLSHKWLKSFQVAVYHTQKQAEQSWLERPEVVMICDRGLMDGAAYLGHKQAFCDLVGDTEENMLSQYNWVFHLESLAVNCLGEYLRHFTSNPNRYESVEEAQQIDLALKQAWSGHPIHDILPGQKSIAEKTAYIKEVIGDHLKHEAPI